MIKTNAAPTISRTELLSRLERRYNFVLVEVLSVAAYDQARLPGAINLPLDRLRELAATLLPDKTSEIVIYGAGPNCTLTKDAARELCELGYRNVRDYAGGKQDWYEAGPQDRGNQQQPRAPQGRDLGRVDERARRFV